MHSTHTELFQGASMLATMEAAPVSAATGALKPVVAKLATLVDDEDKRFKAVHKEIESLASELAAMDAFMKKMSGEEDLDVQDDVWMNEVRELSYDMEDCIDDFVQSIDDKGTKPDGFMEKIKHLLGKMKARRWTDNEIEDLKKQVTNVGERSSRYKTQQAFSDARNATIDPRALTIFKHASELVGIDEPKMEIIKLLTKGDEFVAVQEQLKVVSIFGSGGIGKTTLANLVYQELKGQFDCWAFLSVSRNPDMMNILRTFLSEISGQGYANTEAVTIPELISTITTFLVDKRYIIVVDDIWDMDTWDVMKCAFPITNINSKIITTTQMNNVAQSCCSSLNGYVYEIRPLEMAHSKQLLHRRLFNSEEIFPPYLEKISNQIFKKCDGLPLAIIAISGLLANTERTIDQWVQVNDSIGNTLERSPSVEVMMKILSLSYFDLPPHLKTCLLYLSIFPEDNFIARGDLIWRWTCEGFIHKEGIYTVNEIGERCFNELLNRGLIQPGKTNKYGKVKGCRVHPIIHDFIIFKSVEENFVTLLGVPISTIGTQSKVVRRLSLQAAKKVNLTMPTTGLEFSYVRSFNVFGNFVELPSLEEFRHLRVLDLQHCLQLGKNVENLVRLLQLRYLNLKFTRIRELPEQIGHLSYLEMLDIRFTDIEELPASIVNLAKLSHLLVGGVKFPDGIAKMQALETLKEVVVPNQSIEFLWGLGQLRNLRKLVLIANFDHFSVSEDTKMVWEKCKKAMISSLCNLGTQNLRSLTIVDGDTLLQEPLCLVTLEKLFAQFCPVLKVPQWVSSLRNLQHVHLEVEGVKQDDLCILGSLTTLLILYLEDASDYRLEYLEDASDYKLELSEKLRISGEVRFQSLRIFTYDGDCNRVDLMFAAGSMPKLEELNIVYVFIDEPESLDFGIENLPCLTTVKCELIPNHGNGEALQTAIERAANTHPNHPTLFFNKNRQ